ncbi:MAG TPA: DoxX family protein [Gammaproteobacteria bacterium]|nr:DoxX family protein [Gammaproteobacteria bacterium]
MLLARILLSHMFILSGLQKITGYAGTAQYMAATGVPDILLPLVIIVEIVGGLAVLIGFFTRWASWALAIFTVLAALLFHWDLANQMQTIMLMKNLAIAGGFLVLAEHGPGSISLDAKFRK